jgi:hypothetical protein
VHKSNVVTVDAYRYFYRHDNNILSIITYLMKHKSRLIGLFKRAFIVARLHWTMTVEEIQRTEFLTLQEGSVWYLKYS